LLTGGLFFFFFFFFLIVDGIGSDIDKLTQETIDAAAAADAAENKNDNEDGAEEED
jgi:hypothetical protein